MLGPAGGLASTPQVQGPSLQAFVREVGPAGARGGPESPKCTRGHTRSWTHGTHPDTHTRTCSGCTAASVMGRPSGPGERPAPEAPSARNGAGSAGRKGSIHQGCLREGPARQQAGGGGSPSLERSPGPRRSGAWGKGLRRGERGRGCKHFVGPTRTSKERGGTRAPPLGTWLWPEALLLRGPRPPWVPTI